jgi:predicted RNA-binding Zn-ribbon protein involved in translation (DUF1610 family)
VVSGVTREAGELGSVKFAKIKLRFNGSDPILWLRNDPFATVPASPSTAQNIRRLKTVRCYLKAKNEFKFECPNCGAKYEVVRVEAPAGPTTDREITCLSCGGPLNGRQGSFLLKYFLRSKRLAGRR